jgi:2-polyprenyl-3-methyl-5-hydroxy-6-metoxy-1,4-benzoquinol methylase
MEYRNRMYKSFISQHWTYTQQLTKDAFDFLATVYNKRFMPFLPKDKMAKIVDIACGSGHFLYFLQKEGYANTSGIDLSGEQIAKAKEIGVKNVQEGDLFEFLPKWSNEFDMIVANDIIEHFTKNEIIQFLDSIHAALKPHGLVLISTGNAFSLFGAGTVFVDFTHEVFFTPISLAQVLRACGFTDVEVHGEKVISRDLRSKMRQILWRAVSKLLLSYIYIEKGFGRKVITKDRDYILEPRMFAVAKKS